MNIEIHGDFGNPNVPSLLRHRIFDLFSDKPYVTEMVVTVSTDYVCDIKRIKQPFIRLFNSRQEHIEEILEMLKTLNIDIEYLELKRFIPKKQ